MRAVSLVLVRRKILEQFHPRLFTSASVSLSLFRADCIPVFVFFFFFPQRRNLAPFLAELTTTTAALPVRLRAGYAERGVDCARAPPHPLDSEIPFALCVHGEPPPTTTATRVSDSALEKSGERAAACLSSWGGGVCDYTGVAPTPPPLSVQRRSSVHVCAFPLAERVLRHARVFHFFFALLFYLIWRK